MPLTTSAKIINQSKNIDNNTIITTWLLEFPRCILPEILTHKLFSRNTASSRAIPVKKMIERTKQNPFIPSYWGKNKSGMSASEEINDSSKAKLIWKVAIDAALSYCSYLDDLGVHKQLANRVTEPFQYIQMVMTTTSDLNFFKLRCDSNAQPEIQELANLMVESKENFNNQKLLKAGEWHLPFITDEETNSYSLSELLIVSCARCARVSYLLVDGSPSSFQKDLELATRLKESGHFSPFEHAAVALPSKVMVGNFVGWMQYRKFIDDEDSNDLSGVKRILTPKQARYLYFNFNPINL